MLSNNVKKIIREEVADIKVDKNSLIDGILARTNQKVKKINWTKSEAYSETALMTMTN